MDKSMTIDRLISLFSPTKVKVFLLYHTISCFPATHQGRKPKRYHRETRYHMIYYKHFHLRTRK